jgi:hypothetical protein
MTDRDLMQQALDALEGLADYRYTKRVKATMSALNKRLAQPEQEPVAWMHPDGRVWTFGRGFDKSTFTIPLSPPAAPVQEPIT